MPVGAGPAFRRLQFDVAVAGKCLLAVAFLERPELAGTGGKPPPQFRSRARSAWVRPSKPQSDPGISLTIT